ASLRDSLLLADRGYIDLGYLHRVSQQGGFFIIRAKAGMNPQVVERFLGVDLGIINLAMDSDGHPSIGAEVERARQRCITHRQTYQATGTKAAKRRLKQLAGVEAKFRRWVNHTISKQLVAYAKDTKAALVLE